jgi:hypothetical protein
MFCLVIGSNSRFPAPKDKLGVESFAGAACLKKFVAIHTPRKNLRGHWVRSKAASLQARFSPYFSLLTAHALVLVLVPVMQIGKMRVRMNQLFMPMDMRMRFTGRIRGCVDMLMMLVVRV